MFPWAELQEASCLNLRPSSQPGENDDDDGHHHEANYDDHDDDNDDHDRDDDDNSWAEPTPFFPLNNIESGEGVDAVKVVIMFQILPFQ